MALIRQTILFEALPERVFKTFMDEKEHTAFTGAKAQIEHRVGGKFSVWDGYATGETKELIPGKKIVQKWRASDWLKDQYSILTLEFSRNEGGTELALTQENVPDDKEKDIAKGWQDYYWKPLKEYLAQHPKD